MDVVKEGHEGGWREQGGCKGWDWMEVDDSLWHSPKESSPKEKNYFNYC